MEQTLSQKMETQISDKLADAFESVIRAKNDYYQNNPQAIPQKSTIDSLIKSVALTNSAISGGSSLIPGPWGMLAVVPELILVIRNQIALIYDIGAANGKKDLMSKELTLMVFISAMGTGVGSLLTVKGGTYLVRRASLQVSQKLVALLGGKITQQAIKSSISKWIPGIGAVAMAAWTNYLTRQIGNKAKELFASKIEFEDNIEDVELIKPLDESIIKLGSNEKSNDFYKIKVLTRLMNIDGKVTDEELAFVTSLIENSDIPAEDKITLTSGIMCSDRTLDGLDSVAASPEDSIALLADLTALAKSDSQFHVTEKLYIKQIGKLLNFSETDIEEVLAS